MRRDTSCGGGGGVSWVRRGCVVVVVGWSWCGDGLGCAVERTEHGKRFGDAAGHIIDCGYLMAQFVQPSVAR